MSESSENSALSSVAVDDDRSTRGGVLAWVDPSSSGLVARVAERLDALEIVGVGGTNRSDATELADRLGTRFVDDLRVEIVERRPGWVLLGTVEGVRRETISAARQAGCRVLTLEPISPETGVEPMREVRDSDTGVDESGEGDVVVRHACEHVIFAPRLRGGVVWGSAADPVAVLGSVRAGEVSMLAPNGSGSLLSRLVDGFDVALSAFGLPETVDASLSGALANPPDDLRGLTGHVTAHLRFRDGASAVIVASDRAARWSRRVVLLGSAGHLEVDDYGYMLLGPDGTDLDRDAATEGGLSGSGRRRRSRRKTARRKVVRRRDQPIDAADLIVAQWQRIMDRTSPVVGAERPADDRHVLACCNAALLSCKTAAPESPGRLLELGRG